MKLFKCQFGKGVACEMQVADTPPPAGTSHILEAKWTGQPSPRVIRPYIAWVNSVNKLLADEWRISIMHVFLTAPGVQEMWVYQPDKPPQRVYE